MLHEFPIDHRTELIARCQSKVTARHSPRALEPGHDHGVPLFIDQLDAAITTDEFRVLNRCLDNAIADAVTEHARMHDRGVSDEHTEQLGVLAHEMRNLRSRSAPSRSDRCRLETRRCTLAGRSGRRRSR